MLEERFNIRQQNVGIEKSLIADKQLHWPSAPQSSSAEKEEKPPPLLLWICEERLISAFSLRLFNKMSSP